MQAGLSRVKSNLMSQVKRGKMNQQQVDKLLSKLKGTLTYDDFKTVDMVVEAVIESIDLKQKIFAGTHDARPASPCLDIPSPSTLPCSISCAMALMQWSP